LSVCGGGEDMYGEGQQECFFHSNNVRFL
jgi:hypothetical protein